MWAAMSLLGEGGHPVILLQGADLCGHVVVALPRALPPFVPAIQHGATSCQIASRACRTSVG